MNKNLNDLLNKNKVQNIFLKYREFLDLSPSLRVEEIKRYNALAPETYTLLFSIKDNNSKNLYWGNASTKNSREKAYVSLKALSEKNFIQEKYFIPNPFYYDKEYNLLIYKMIEGKILMKEIPKLSIKEFIAKIKLCAQWLAKMHKLNCKIDLPGYEYDYVRDYLSKYFPKLTNNLDQIVKEKYQKLQSQNKLLIHGDFQPNNIIFTNDRVSVIDFNDASLDNPMIDVGGFLAQLKSMLVRFSNPKYFENLKDEFLTEYQKICPFTPELKNDFKIHYSLKLLQILSSLCAELPGRDPRAEEIIKKTYSYWEESLGD